MGALRHSTRRSKGLKGLHAPVDYCREAVNDGGGLEFEDFVFEPSPPILHSRQTKFAPLLLGETKAGDFAYNSSCQPEIYSIPFCVHHGTIEPM